MTLIERPRKFQSEWTWKIELSPQSTDIVQFRINAFGLETISVNGSKKIRKISMTSNRSHEFELSDGSPAKIYATSHWNDFSAALFPHVELHHKGKAVQAEKAPNRIKLDSKRERQRWWASTFFWIGLIIAFINFPSILGFGLSVSVGTVFGFIFGTVLDNFLKRHKEKT